MSAGRQSEMFCFKRGDERVILRTTRPNTAVLGRLPQTHAALHEIIEDLKTRGIEVYLAEVRSLVREVMRRSGFEEKLGSDHFYLTVRRAVERAAALGEDRGSSLGGVREMCAVKMVSSA